MTRPSPQTKVRPPLTWPWVAGGVLNLLLGVFVGYFFLAIVSELASGDSFGRFVLVVAFLPIGLWGALCVSILVAGVGMLARREWAAYLMLAIHGIGSAGALFFVIVGGMRSAVGPLLLGVLGVVCAALAGFRADVAAGRLFRRETLGVQIGPVQIVHCPTCDLALLVGVPACPNCGTPSPAEPSIPSAGASP